MKNWFLKNLGDAMLAFDQQEHIRELVLSVEKLTARPGEVAAFIRHESEGRLHCEVKVYLSPMSTEVARAVNAQPCKKPQPDDLSLLAGTAESWNLLFPESAN
jgi:hypothetical protein